MQHEKRMTVRSKSEHDHADGLRCLSASNHEGEVVRHCPDQVRQIRQKHAVVDTPSG